MLKMDIKFSSWSGITFSVRALAEDHKPTIAPCPNAHCLTHQTFNVVLCKDRGKKLVNLFRIKRNLFNKKVRIAESGRTDAPPRACNSEEHLDLVVDYSELILENSTRIFSWCCQIINVFFKNSCCWQDKEKNEFQDRYTIICILEEIERRALSRVLPRVKNKQWGSSSLRKRRKFGEFLIETKIRRKY